MVSVEWRIKNTIDTVLAREGFQEKVSYVVEYPADMSHGDFASNVALVAAKKIGQSPQELAKKIVTDLSEAIEGIERIDIAGPGFINFHLSRGHVMNVLKDTVYSAETWGKGSVFDGDTVLFEYTSPNLFKPLHVGNLVGNIVGESLTRLFEFLGARVKRVNYPSDIGLTVAKGVWALRELHKDPDDIAELGEAYRYGNERYENDALAKKEIEEVNRLLYTNEDGELAEIRRRGIETSKRALDAICAKLGTSFDDVIYESDAAPRGLEIAQDALVQGVFKESEGAVIYEGERHGLHTRVFVNRLGLPTYEAKDLGNFAIKNERFSDWARMYIVTGGEQREYFKVLFAAIRELFPIAQKKEIVHIPTGFLTLTTGKMSSRLGNVLTGEAIIADLRSEALERAQDSRAENVEVLADDIATAALKYQILKQSLGSDIVFDAQRALSFEGASGPYLQYTYARTVSVLERAHEAGIELSPAPRPDELSVLERYIVRFPEVVRSAGQHHEPHRLVTYLTELASHFNAFYAMQKIVDTDDEYAPYRLFITEAVRNTLHQGLYLLGMHAPKKM